MKLKDRWVSGLDAVANLGLLQTVFYAVQRVRNRLFSPPRFRVLSRYARYPLYCRSRTSDVEVFGQIFVHREYRCLDEVKNAQLIIDCGANVGFSSAYLLSRFPDATLIAVEPDPGNFAALQANLAPFGSRFKAHCTGIWSHSTGLVLDEKTFGDGREWARTVREVRPGEKPMMTATDIGTLLEQSGRERISVLKVDIEGSEAVVFSSNFQHWLEKVDNLVIEIHGPHCDAVFRAAVEPYGFEISHCDELTVCRRVAARLQ